jgi:UDP-GlcNAc:undecaprenyl-phosphate GlcNAc-1-phosphate transferase
MLFVYFFIGAALTSFALTPIAMWVAERIGALDEPDPRKVHSEPTPRLGGMAIFGTVILSLGAALAFSPGLWEVGPWPNVLVGGLVVYLLGFTDDVSGLSPVNKLIVQFLAALIAVSSGLRIENVDIPGVGVLSLGVTAVPVTMFWIVGITNAFNLIDGLDGLAGGLGLIAALALFTLGWQTDAAVALIAAILAGALVGFLRHNFNPARIFMGDSGSLLIGYLLACLAVRTNSGENSVSLVAPLLAMAIPLLDTATAMLRRYWASIWGPSGLRLSGLLKIGVMFQPDRAHIHHKLVDRGLSQRQAVLVLYMLGVVLACLGWYSKAYEASVAWPVALAGVGLFFAVRLMISKGQHG